MKKLRLSFLTAALGVVACFSSNVQAQTVLDFEELTIADSNFYIGADLAGSFMSGDVTFLCSYDTSWNGWSDGFCYTNRMDVTTGTWSDPYSSWAGAGFGGSGNYLTALANTYYTTNFTVTDSVHLAGFYVTNNTYAGLSMTNGDGIAKKFGDSVNVAGEPDGTNGEDWFLLTVYGYLNGVMTDSATIYLADYRFHNDELDYILKDWTWLDLKGLGYVDSLTFLTTSSDNGDFGMNTPSYFCMDNLTMLDANTKTNLDTVICREDTIMIAGSSVNTPGVWFDSVAVDSIVSHTVAYYAFEDYKIDLPESICNDTAVALASSFAGTFSGTGVEGDTLFNAASLSIGLKTVTFDYTNSFGCAEQATASVEVLECGGTNIGMEEGLSITPKVYPTISTSILNIELSEAINFVYEVRNLQGLTVKEGMGNSNVQLNLNDLSNGIYIVNVRTNANFGTYTAKIIKK